MSGHESGLMAYPLEGTLNRNRLAYGRNDRPIIRGIYGREYALPPIAIVFVRQQHERGELKSMQHKHLFFQKTERNAKPGILKAGSQTAIKKFITTILVDAAALKK